MKKWFPYRYGYVNIDSDNIYLTSTGNWSEVSQLYEKNELSKKANEARQRKIKRGLFFVFALFSFAIIKNITSTSISFLLIVALAFLGYKVYQYRKSDLGSRYKIPLEKLERIIIEDTTVTLIFLNGDNLSDQEILTDIPFQGIEFFSEQLTQYK